MNKATLKKWSKTKWGRIKLYLLIMAAGAIIGAIIPIIPGAIIYIPGGILLICELIPLARGPFAWIFRKSRWSKKLWKKFRRKFYEKTEVKLSFRRNRKDRK